jgi:hypothetical protein
MVSMIRIVILTAAAASVLCVGVPKVQAGTYGDAPWCAVRSLGTGEMEWDCEYYSAAACAPTVIAGNRGFCNENPYFVAAAPPNAPWPPPHHRRRHIHH